MRRLFAVLLVIACGGASTTAPSIATHLTGTYYLQDIDLGVAPGTPPACRKVLVDQQAHLGYVFGTPYTDGYYSVYERLLRSRATFDNTSVAVVWVTQKHTQITLIDPQTGGPVSLPDSLWAPDSSFLNLSYSRQDDKLAIPGSASYGDPAGVATVGSGRVFPGDTAIYTNQVWCGISPAPDRFQYSRTPQ